MEGRLRRSRDLGLVPRHRAGHDRGGARSCTLAGGNQLEEDVVNVDGELRRFQYRITGGMPVEHHLGTVDVLEDGADGALVVYSTEITPDSLADVIGPSIDGGVQGLKAHLEDSS